MNHYSIGDGLTALALAGAFIGYFYLKYRERRDRLEIIHQERLAAMDKGIPLPELPLDPPILEKRPDPQVHLVIGIVLMTIGAGAMLRFLWAEKWQFLRFLRWTDEMRAESKSSSRNG